MVLWVFGRAEPVFPAGIGARFSGEALEEPRVVSQGGVRGRVGCDSGRCLCLQWVKTPELVRRLRGVGFWA